MRISSTIKNTVQGIFVLFFILASTAASYGQEFPEKPVPARLVNDFTNTLQADEKDALEKKLVAFNDSTSTQIAIVMMQTLDGYPLADYSFKLGEKWGIGQKGKNNGIIILISLGERKVFIAPGYGLEGSVTDAVSRRIIEMVIKPAFRQKQYYEGLDEATNTLMSLTKGEFTADEYVKKGHKFPLLPFMLIIGIIIFIGFYKVKKTINYASMNHVPFWTAWMLLNALSSRGSGSWNDFSSGRGGFGGFGGGSNDGGSFGGFGGGSFGGGGAGGDW